MYFSPEVIRQMPYDYKVDSWALGCCLFHLAALEPPFSGENIEQLGNNIVNEEPKKLPARYSEKFVNFVVHTLM